MDDLRLLHAADLHVDSPMRGLAAYDGAPVDEVRSATRRALSALVDEAVRRSVHAVLLAGDLYDGTWRDFNTGLFVASELARLHDAGIPVVLVHGNHDAESQLTRRLRLPPNVTVLGSSAPETTLLDDLGVAVHGQSYPTRAVVDDLAAGYPEADPGLLNVGLLHTCLDGTLGHQPYAPCSTRALRAKRYDYWALGHVHEHRVVERDPLIVFPGNLQGRHVREAGPKGAVLATFRGRQGSVEQLVVDQVRWEQPEVDCTGASDVDEVLDRCRSVLEVAADVDRRCVAVRLVLGGTTRCDAALRSRQEWLTAEVRAASLATGGAPLLVEQVVLATAPARPLLDPGGGGLGGELARVLDELRPSLAAVVADEAGRLAPLASLRAQLRALCDLEATGLGDEALPGLLDDAAALLLERLAAAAEGRSRAH
ncbi:MAG: DNA repair exonuclease [Actinomycetota bacterium]|nr:DNA repair exonuclease [Actinomycetota bacterium]